MRQWITIAVATLLATAAPVRWREVVQAGGATNALPSVQVTPGDALIDSPLTIRLSGFGADSPVSLEAVQYDAQRRPWRGTRRARTDQSGRLALRDPMSLITTMKPPAGIVQAFEPPAFPMPIDLTISASSGGKAGRTVVHRLPIAPDVVVRTVDTNGVSGVLFEPKITAAHRGVLTLGGSEGGQPRRTPALIASHGFTVLSLAYFGAKGLPQSLTKIPVETVLRGIDWLCRQPGVEKGGIYLEGESRGGELAILAGMHSPQVRGIVALVPTPIIFSGLEFGKGPVDISPWTFRGVPVPYVTYNVWRQYQATRDVTLLARAILPLQRLRVPLLIVAGKDDRLALSDTTSRLAIEHARKSGGGAAITLLSYENAGHNIDPPFEPTANLASAETPYGKLEFGGTAEGYAHADAESWPRILAFLKE